MPPRPIHFIIFLLVLRRMYMQCALRFNTQEITRSFVSRGSINHSFQSHDFARVVIKKKTYNRHGGTVDGICSCKLNTRLSSTSRKKGGGNQAAGVRMRKMRETWERRGKIRLGSPWSDLNPSICPAANTITSTSTSAQEIRGIAGSLTPKRGTNLVETELRYVTTRAVILSYSSPPFLLYFLFFFLFFLIETFFSLSLNDHGYGRSRTN